MSVAVIRDFTLAHVEVHGVKDRSTEEPVTERTLFQTASLSTTVSSVGIVRLAQEGVVSLDRDVDDCLTSWQVPDNAFRATEKVTMTIRRPRLPPCGPPPATTPASSSRCRAR